MADSALTLEQAGTALKRCDKIERRIISEATPHEAALMLEAKFYADATIRDKVVSSSEAGDFVDPRAWMAARFA